MRYGFDAGIETWGWYSAPPVAAEVLQLSKYLGRLSEGGVVLDVGAGSAQSLAAAVFAERPDLTIVSVDPGFELWDVERTLARDRNHAISYFPPAKQEQLRGTDAWYANMLSGYAEDLPVYDASVD
jgi:hypothetical protein